MRILNVLFIALILIIFSCENNPSNTSPYSPEKSMQTISVPDGFRIELVASEPLIRDPVDIAFGTDGKLYVVEMPDYPSRGMDPPPSNIILLTDTNNDGVYDTRTVFAEDLPFVNGVMPWKNGVLVTNAPDIVYFEDSTGDGKADIRRVVLTGFATTNPQLRVSNLRYGLDNWIYGAHFRAFGAGGDAQFEGKGEPLYFPDDPNERLFDIKPGMDFRFQPEGLIAERAGGESQFGNAFDAYGNRFTLMNSDHIRHVVIPFRYTLENPYFSLSTEMESISDHGKATRLYSITENMLDFRSSDHEVGHVTSACGNCIYTGDIFPNDYSSVAFFCDPARNVVHVDRLSLNGATFAASLILEEQEFMASTESWFRPVNTTIGPDGALYVVDMYRKLVEHPAFIPHSGVRTEDGGYQTQVGIILEADFYEGQNLGRIYRIVPDDYKKDSSAPIQLKDNTSEVLIDYLDNPNYWWRINAQRLLVDQGDQSVRNQLESMFDKKSSPEGRIHALWTLEGLKALDESIIIKALSDESDMVRKQAVILSESHLSDQNIQDNLLRMSQDPNVHVQFQLALTLSKLPHEKSFEPLQQIASQHLNDDWFQTAIMLSISDNSASWYKSIIEIPTARDEDEVGKGKFLNKIASVIGARQRTDQISELLSVITHEKMDSELQIASINGIREGIQRARGSQQLTQKGQDDLFRLISSTEPELQNTALQLAKYIQISNSPTIQSAVKQANSTLQDGNASASDKKNAVRILGLDPNGLQMDVFANLLSLHQPLDVQKAAAEVLINNPGKESIQLLIDRWDTYTSDIREIVENGFLKSQEFTYSLMKAIEEGKIESRSLTHRSKSVLKQNPDKQIREMANTLLESFSDDQRKEVASKYYDAATIKGDISKGKLLFKQVCSQCHLLDGVGFEVGPDLLTYTNRDKIDFLKAIIIPNSDIAAGYEGNVIQTKDGQTFSGVIANEGSSHVVLRNVGGGEQTLSRDNIEYIRPMAVSLMPDGLESGMSVEDMGNLLEYLKSLK